MSLKHVVLAVVSDTLAHGYELHAEVAAAFPVARPCDTARVYGILVDLGRAGLVSSRLEATTRGRTRKQYRLTPAGEAELSSWLALPRPGGSLLRRGLMVRLAFLADEERAAGVRSMTGAVPGWNALIESKSSKRDGVLWPDEAETRIARWIRLRAAAHIEAELRVLRSLEERP